MICDKCRTLNPNENTKCVRCGNKLEAPPAGKTNPSVAKSIYNYGNNNINPLLTSTKKVKEQKPFRSSPVIMLVGLIAAFILFYQYRSLALDYWQDNLKKWFLSPDSLAVISGTDTTVVSAFEDETVVKKKAVKSNGHKTNDGDVDYYKIMKEKGITESNELPDTTIYQSRSQGASAQELRKKIRREGGSFFGNDNKQMVLIPGQTLIMGSNNGLDIEGPAHEVSLTAYYMDIHEVTNTEFKKFLNATGYKPKGSLSHLQDARFNDPRQPVVDVAYEDAQAYAEWVGKRLPTESEWECAAKGGKGYVYPTGNSINSSSAVIKTGGVKSVGSLKANPFGIYDLAGNAAEIVSGTLKPYPGSTVEKKSAKSRVCRGGSWTSGPEDLRCTRRKEFDNANSSGTIGFRCVVSAE